jgi:RNA polymerase sigma-70 factor, ECF subfamily
MLFTGFWSGPTVGVDYARSARAVPGSQFPRTRSLVLLDRELLERLRKGDTTAFDAIFRTWYGPLVGTAERMLRDRAVAEELVQDVMLELWRRRETLAPDGSAQAYLFQATRNRVLNHLRHLKIEQRSEPELLGESASAPRADAEVTETELSVAVQDAVRSLPDRCREVFELSRVHGLKYSEIATQLGISVKTVEAQMGKALRTLRERLANWLPDS